MSAIRNFLAFHAYTKLPWSMVNGRFGLWLVEYAGAWAYRDSCQMLPTQQEGS